MSLHYVSLCKVGIRKCVCVYPCAGVCVLRLSYELLISMKNASSTVNFLEDQAHLDYYKDLSHSIFLMKLVYYVPYTDTLREFRLNLGFYFEVPESLFIMLGGIKPQGQIHNLNGHELWEMTIVTDLTIDNVTGAETI